MVSIVCTRLLLKFLARDLSEIFRGLNFPLNRGPGSLALCYLDTPTPSTSDSDVKFASSLVKLHDSNVVVERRWSEKGVEEHVADADAVGVLYQGSIVSLTGCRGQDEPVTY